MLMVAAQHLACVTFGPWEKVLPLSALFNFCFMPVESNASEHRFGIDSVASGQEDNSHYLMVYIVKTRLACDSEW